MKLKTWRSWLLPVYLIACCTILPFNSWLETLAPPNHARPRRLVIVLDGVPYETIAKLRAEGCFPQFQEPARMISTFPSLTNLALTEILHTPDSPGYEDHYFDREQNRLIGGMQDRFNGRKFIRGTYRETFDYHASAVLGGLAYGAAPFSTYLVAHADLAALKKSFRKSTAPVFVGYIGASDSLAHLGGEAMLKAFLRTLNRTVAELSEESGGQLEVEMLSDHGNRYDDYRHVKLNDALKRAGFATEKSLQNERSVVLPKYGLVGAAVLFTANENRARVAETCANTEGVDFAVYLASNDVIELLSRRGRARVLRVGERFKYENLGGDVLNLQKIIVEMQQRGEFDEQGFASREAWYRATLAHSYIDPLRRLFDGLTAHVRNRADVIASFADGYLIGSPFMSAFATMHATHGNLLRGETEGFAMSTKLGRQMLGEYVRGLELERLFALHERTKAESFFGARGHCELGPALAQQMAAGSR